MLFFFKRPTVVVDAFTEHAGVFQTAKFENSNLHHPKWWKSMPSTFKVELPSSIQIDAPTMTTCLGFLELYNNSFTLPLWSDLIVKVTPDLQWASQWSDQEGATTILSHNPEQYNNNFPDKVHLKISSPWLLNEKEGVRFAWTEPTWHMLKYNPGVTVLPGIVNYKYQNSTHINVLLDARETQQYHFEYRQPMVSLIPLTERNVEFKHHLVSPSELKAARQRSYQSAFLRSYFKNKKVLDSQPKCPFH